MAFGKPYVKGQTGNAGGRPKISTAIRAAGFDPESLRAEVIQILVNGMRTLDPADPKESKSWQFCVDRIDVRVNGPVKEFVHVDESEAISDEEYQAEQRLIAREVWEQTSPDERAKLFSNDPTTDPAPPPTIQ